MQTFNFSELILLIGIYVLIMTVLYAYKFINSKDVIKAWYKKRLIINCVSLLFLLIIFVVLNLFRGVSMSGGAMYGIRQGKNVSTIDIPNFNFRNQVPNNGDITDTREFIKKTFSANLKTRGVEDVAKKVELLIKGLGGRIDNSNITNTYATFSFVIPKSNLDDFESQIRSYVHKKLYSQTITSQNLLGEKQDLERNQDSTKDSIDSLTTQRQQVQNDYTKNANAIKSKIETKSSQLKTVRDNILKKENELSVATNTNIITEKNQELRTLRNSESNLNQEITTLVSEFNNLSNLFKSQMSNLGASLEDQNNVLISLDKQADSFLNKVETVQGTIYISFVSVWAIIDIFSPINPIIILFVAFIIIRLIFLNKQEKKLLELQR